jgi:cation:H+ antiporter
VDGSSSIAKRIGVSDLVIGLTIVSFGTSAPELLVNIVASFKGASDIGIGNILGSNIANILLILGIAAVIYPLHIKKTTTWRGIPLNFLTALVLIIMANDVFIDRASESILSRSDGFILMLFFVIFMYYSVGLAKTEPNHKEKYQARSLPLSILMTVGGCIALAFGGQWVVDGAVIIARNFGLSEAFIGLTIVAVGTSLPELATSAVAAYKHNADIAVGNVVGSNIFNIFWVLGLSAIIRPLPFVGMVNQDIFIFMAVTILLFVFSFTGKRHHIDRIEGVIFVALYIAYIVFLVMRG